MRLPFAAGDKRKNERPGSFASAKGPGRFSFFAPAQRGLGPGRETKVKETRKNEIVLII